MREYTNASREVRKLIFYNSMVDYSTMEQISDPEVTDWVIGRFENLKEILFDDFTAFDGLNNPDQKFRKLVSTGKLAHNIIADELDAADSRGSVHYKPTATIRGMEFDIRSSVDKDLFEIKRLTTASTLRNDYPRVQRKLEKLIQSEKLPYDSYYLYSFYFADSMESYTHQVFRNFQYVLEDLIKSGIDEPNPVIDQFLNIRMIPIEKDLTPRENLKPVLDRS